MKIKIKDISGGINSVPGYKALGVRAGLKKANKPDLAMIICEKPVVTAGIFTRNRVCAAPVKVAKTKINRGFKRLVLINSGNANACTGDNGIIAVKRIEKYTSKKFNIKEGEIISCSTGIIGQQLPVEKIFAGVDKLAEKLAKGDYSDAAKAIMTTDTFEKEVALEVRVGSLTSFRVAGFAKGAGMIAPNMATMLAFIVTDCSLKRATLRNIMRECAERTFNRITVDGDMSTNDTVLCLASTTDKESIGNENKIIFAFKSAISVCMERLARMIVADGEGATKLIEVEVVNAKTENDAKKIASKIANSNLFKTAVYGESPNWGRIIAAAGAAGVKIDDDKIDIAFGNIKTVRKGIAVQGTTQKLRSYLKEKIIKITVNINKGSYSCKFLTCDMTPEYVKINAEYS
ncbi:MAG: bifunctional glutamate N-acetyltransferase/amino-acid acetyltransferase ArgJ [Candidatus Schekmanbacteria bacterium]|nr:bifunctional glutamate N-acetyltransferase/amino-acid acetyltransferase ArgJ [Candidatus Schekmanbacteria bacterium]